MDTGMVVSEMLRLSDDSFDDSMKVIVRGWGDPPTALQVLEVLDLCINGALASGIVVATLQAMYDEACDREGTTHDEVVRLATWRGP